MAGENHDLGGDAAGQLANTDRLRQRKVGGTVSKASASPSPPGQRGRSDIATRDRLPSLTALRFWAALLVVTYHLTRQVGSIQPISALVYFGRSGVTFFFVLSGFVLAWTYLGTAVRLRVFLWRRFARLWPLVAVTAVLSLVAYAALGVAVSPIKALSTFLFLQAWRVDWAAGANPAAWSLSDEAFFYLLFPLLLVAATHPRARTLLWVLAGLTVPVLFLLARYGGWMDTRFDYFPPSRLVHFVVGVLCGAALRRGARIRLGLGAAAALVVAYHTALFALHLAFGSGRWIYSGSQWWSVVPFTLLIVAAAQADLDGRSTILTKSWALRLGHWSFAWYLVHEIVVRVVVRWFGRPAGLPATVLLWIGLLAVTQALAYVLYTLVEHPAERALRQWVPSRGDRNKRSGRGPDTTSQPEQLPGDMGRSSEPISPHGPLTPSAAVEDLPVSRSKPASPLGPEAGKDPGPPFDQG